ncbi:MAG: hypothetical protein WCG51_01915 [Elusimicrobiota bacterium]
MITILMGLGHIRAASALRDIAIGNILIDGSRDLCGPGEHKTWEKVRSLYYFMSKAGELPIVGKLFLWLLHRAQEIPSFYPARDLSAPTFGVRHLEKLIQKSGLCATVVDRLRGGNSPAIHTFYASAIAGDHLIDKKQTNYLLLCDADINRIWVPRYPSTSGIRYLAPCSQVKKRLLLYGVPEANIFLTGFPLPKENIGSKEDLEVLKGDVLARLMRLDPKNNFYNIHQRSVDFFLGDSPSPELVPDCLTLTFAVGGSGAQAGMALRILRSLRHKIAEGRIRVYLSAGIHREVYEQFIRYICTLGLSRYYGDSIEIIYHENVFSYLKQFNAVLRSTDVLWTKPSELSFYCALGLPILTAPAVGTHEELNREWLQDVHAGITPAGPIEHTDEWLFDLRESGVLAEAAWDGFLKGRKLGTYKIEELIQTGTLTPGNSPLER